MKPMEGIKVIEFSNMLAGPMTARILAEWGADVIKVESVDGDIWRTQGATSLSPTTEAAHPNFDMQNLNKRFLSLNIKKEEGKKVFMKLLETADVFLTNYRVQALEKMGLTYDQLKNTYPKLIHASILGYGEEGPEKDRPGYDYTAFYARTGLLADLAPAGGPPIMTVVGFGDHCAAVALAGAISAALFRRERTGEGDKVDVSLLQIGTFILSSGLLNGFNGREYPRSHEDCSHACSNTYQGSDGEWLYLAVIDYRRFPEFCEVIGLPELAEDIRFSTPVAYYKNKKELVAILDKKFKEKPISYWHHMLAARDLPHEVLAHFKDVPEDPQVIANHYAYHYEYSDGTKTVFTNGPVHFRSVDSKSIPHKISGPIGRDTSAILKELGYSEEKIRSMCDDGDIR